MFKKLIATAATLGTSLYVFATPVFADTIDLCSQPGGANTLKIQNVLCNLTVPNLITFGIQAILVVALVLAFIFLVVGGIKWILSGGDKAGTEAAKGTVTAALIGLIIVFLSWMFLNLVLTSFGQSGQKFEIPVIKTPTTPPANGLNGI